MAADIINLNDRRPGRDNLLMDHPLEFRRGDWHSGYAMLCTRQESKRYESHRMEALGRPGHQHLGFVPSHFSLTDGYHYTLQGLFRHRENETLMRRVYRLAGFMECITNASSPVLRTDLLRRLYQSILEERETLGVVWRGNVRNFLFPLHPDRYDPNLFLHRVSLALTLKDLYDVIETETNVQFDLLSQFYVFYLPKNLFVSEQ